MDISKNTLEVIRVQRTEYRGKDLVDFRLWVQSDEPGGEYIPTKKGISFRRELLGEVLRALRTLRDDQETTGSESEAG